MPERSGLRPHVPLSIIILLFYFPFPCSTSFTKTDTVIAYAFKLHSSPLSPPLFSYTPGLVHSDNAYRHQASTTRQPIRAFFYSVLAPPFMCLTYTPYSITYTGTPEFAPTIQTLDTADTYSNTHVCKTALLLVEEGIDSNQVAFPFSLFSLSPASALSSFSETALWNRCPRDPNLSRACFLSRPLSLLVSLSPSLSLVWSLL